jgi:hypothetical protein
LRKLQQFYQLKFETDRLAQFTYKIDITIEEARQSGELISVGYSQLIRSYHKVKGINFSQDNLTEFLEQRKQISHKFSSPVTIRELVMTIYLYLILSLP